MLQVSQSKKTADVICLVLAVEFKHNRTIARSHSQILVGMATNICRHISFIRYILLPFHFNTAISSHAY